jgi:isopentenyl phosphate kinase
MTLIKLGGGLIAPKDWQSETADLGTIKRLVKEIKDSQKKVLLVSGSGNFGHMAVKRYGISTIEGVKKVRKSAKKIGEIVTREMKDQGFDTELIEPNKYFEQQMELDFDKTLVFYGDVVGKEIYSGEKIIKLLIPDILIKGLKVEKIIQTSKEVGVWDEEGKTIPEINAKSWEKIKWEVGGSTGVDVTGGMLHKVEESLEIARKYRINTWIISGQVEGRLREVLDKGETKGTRVY